MQLTKYISLPVFLISFAIGLFFIYIIGPEEKVVYKYPNVGENNFLYKDNSNSCFKPVSEEVSCPTNPLAISTIPVQA